MPQFSVPSRQPRPRRSIRALAGISRRRRRRGEGREGSIGAREGRWGASDRQRGRASYLEPREVVDARVGGVLVNELGKVWLHVASRQELPEKESARERLRRRGGGRDRGKGVVSGRVSAPGNTAGARDGRGTSRVDGRGFVTSPAPPGGSAIRSDPSRDEKCLGSGKGDGTRTSSNDSTLWSTPTSSRSHRRRSSDMVPLELRRRALRRRSLGARSCVPRSSRAGLTRRGGTPRNRPTRWVPKILNVPKWDRSRFSHSSTRCARSWVVSPFVAS